MEGKKLMQLFLDFWGLCEEAGPELCAAAVAACFLQLVVVVICF